MDDADFNNTEEMHIADVDGLSADIMPIKAHFGFSASKDMISTPRGSAQSLDSVRDALAMHPLAIPSAAIPQGFEDRPALAKQAPSKQADRQVQPWNLSRPRLQPRTLGRENCGLGDFESCPPTSSPPSLEDQDLLEEKSFESRLSKGVERFITEHSYDGLDVQTCADSREASENFLELLDVRVAALGQKLNGIFSEMLHSRLEKRMAALTPMVETRMVEIESRVETRIAELESRLSSEMMGSRAESRLVALETHPLSQTPDAHVETRFVALERRLTEITDPRVEMRLAALESHAAQRNMSDSKTAKSLDEEVCALSQQIQTMNSRISKYTSRSQIKTEHIAALEERMVVVDKDLSEFRCEYLEGCIRHHKMEELVVAIHSSVRELQLTLGDDFTHGLSSHSNTGGNSISSPRRRHAANGLHAGAADAHSSVIISPRNRSQAKLETIPETLMDEKADCAPADQSIVKQLNESGNMVPEVDGLGDREPSLAEPEPEAQEPGSPGARSKTSWSPGAEDIVKVKDNFDTLMGA